MSDWLIPLIVGLFGGVFGGVVSPLLVWWLKRVDGRYLKRCDQITDWRYKTMEWNTVIREAEFHNDTAIQLESQYWYPTLRRLLTPEEREQVEGALAIQIPSQGKKFLTRRDNILHPTIRALLDAIDRIEAGWKVP